MNSKNFSLAALKTKFRNVSAKFGHYNLILFISFVALLYGFLLLRVSSLSNAEPAAEAVIQQVKTGQVTRIDPAVVKQLESLQDNSVSVQALFDEARSNPFQ